MNNPYNNNNNNNSGSFNPFGTRSGGNPTNNFGGQNNFNPFGRNNSNPLNNPFGRNNSGSVNNPFGTRTNPNYGGNQQYSNAVYNSGLNQQIPKNITSTFLVSSVLLIVTGILYFFLDLVRKALVVISSGKKAIGSLFDADLYGAYYGAKGTVESAYDVINHHVCMLTLVQVITGIVGIIFVVVFTSKKYERSTSYAKIIPFFCGAVAVITSIVYTILLIAAHTSFFLWLIMTATIIFTPIFFTRSALRFYKW